MKVVVDSSVIIDFIRRKEPQDSFYYKIAVKEEIAVSLLTISEIFSGRSAQTESGKIQLEKLIRGMNIYLPDYDQARLVGRLRYLYQLSLGDAFVASLSLRFKFPLATLDKKAFVRVKGLKLI